MGVLFAAQTSQGISYDSLGALIIAVVVLSAFNAVLKPLLILVALPLVLFTLGFGILLINAALFLLVAKLVIGFHVAGFGAAFWGALAVSLSTLAGNLLLGDGIKASRPSRRPPRRPTPRYDDDDVIDI